MRTAGLDSMFHPESIAVIGIDRHAGSAADLLIRNLEKGGFQGKVFPVNPHRKTVQGLPARPSLSDLPKPADLALSAVPFPEILEVLEECSRAGTGNLVLVSGLKTGGFPTDPEQKAAVEKQAVSLGLQLVGPNSFGIFCGRSRLNASLADRPPLPGKTAFVCQSNSVLPSVLEISQRECIGVSYLVSLGDMGGLDFGDIIDYMGEDFDVSSIVLCIENLARFRNFMSAARAVSRVKPIVAMKVGRSRIPPGFSSPLLPGDICSDTVYDAAFRRAGIVRVNTFEELIDCSELLSKQPRPKGNGLAIITNAEVLGAMAVDALADHDVVPVELGPETIGTLDEIFEHPWSRTNPVVVSECLAPEGYGKLVDVCLKAPEVQGLLVVLTPQFMGNSTKVASFLSVHLKRKPYPVLTCWMGGAKADKQRRVFNLAGLTTFETPERAVQAFMYLFRYGQNIEILQQIPPKSAERLEIERENARTLIDRALEGVQPDLPADQAKTLVSAYGIPVSPLPGGCDYRLALGSQTDRNFGPVIFFGTGGEFAAGRSGRSIAFPPLNRLLAGRLIEETRVFDFPRGKGSRPVVDPSLPEEILIRLSQLVTDFPEVDRIEIDPLEVGGGNACAVQVRVKLKPATVKSPLHMVISPYPAELETRTEIKGVGKLTIRPVRPEDAPLMVALFESLSPRSIYLRFFSHLKRLPHKMLAQFTQVDYDREIAMVAISISRSGEKMLGVARIIAGMDRKKAEFSTIVGDPWQGKGIGAALLKRCLGIAKERGVETVWGLVLPENTQMLALGRKLKFKVKRVPGASEYELNIDLKKDFDSSLARTDPKSLKNPPV